MNGSGPEAPCRLFVFLARAAPIGVVLSRGPSAGARLSLWRTDTDSFEHGQWLAGRVYERRSDVSADGNLFVYFARRSSGPSQENRDTWVAVSRPPWFTALALWFVGGTYHTGGCFPDGRSLWPGYTADPPDQGRLPSWLSVHAVLPPYVDRTSEWPNRTVWINRLLRDGWVPSEGAGPEMWERRNPAGDLTLAMTDRFEFGAYGGPHVTEYAVLSESADDVFPLGRADWADWDHQGRLVVAHGGRLWHWEGPGARREIADFNPQTPDPAPAPDWAREWPRR